jgi:hypothetical protein
MQAMTDNPWCKLRGQESVTEILTLVGSVWMELG